MYSTLCATCKFLYCTTRSLQVASGGTVKRLTLYTRAIDVARWGWTTSQRVGGGGAGLRMKSRASNVTSQTEAARFTRPLNRSTPPRIFDVELSTRRTAV